MSVNKMPTKEINPRLTELARSKQEDLSQLTNLYKKCSSSFETNPNSTTHTSITRSKVSSKIISSPLYNENKEVNKVQEPEEVDVFGDVMIRVNIFLGENVGVKSLNIKINKEDTIDELIRKSLSGFNQIFLNIETNYRISPIFTEYHLKPSKKSGKPNLDLPSFNRYVTISSCGETQYSLVWKEGESCDFVVLSKPKPKSKCATCLIL